MKNAQKPDHISLNTLIGRLREGRYVVPDFQREFEWKPWDIRELLKSVFLDYYIGSLLLWKGNKKNYQDLACEPIFGFEGTENPEYVVLDGQQRLTALHYAFLAPDTPLPNRASRAVYFLRVDKFMADEDEEAFHYDWLSKRIKKTLGDTNTQYANHIFPFSVIGADGWELPNWVQGYAQFWQKAAGDAEGNGDSEQHIAAAKHAGNAKAFGEHLKDITGQYQISYVELDQELEVGKVCDIFTKINSQGIRLDVFDLMNALLKPKGLQLKHLWREARERLSWVDSDKMNVYILQVMSILRQSYCSPKYLYFLLPGHEKPIRDPGGTRRSEVLVATVEEFEERWTQSVLALESAIKLLKHPQEFGAISSKYLPYVSILPVFTALQSHVKTRPPGSQLDAQRKIRHWYWASVFMNRYSGSVESTSARDFLDVKSWLDDDASEPALIQEFKNRFRGLELRREVRRGTSVYNGIFNLLVLAGARDWVTGNIPQHDDLDDHHIVPASWGAKHLKGNLVHTILNRTPLTPDTNRKAISDKLPNVYLPELMAQIDEKAIKGILETHFISPKALEILLRDPFTPDDFEEFITERQKTFQEAIENLLVKERLDLPANLRELDAEVEAIELALRQIIVTALGDDPAKLPSHVQAKTNERTERATKKNAALDADYFDTLAGMLEYCDLRELQDTISTKTLWPQFQARFANKETLSVKFGQLAELRNGIAHNRTVDEVTRKEGEAALIWFRQVLEKSER